MSNVYVVMGTTGKWERQEWSVAAYTDEKKAKQHAALAQYTSKDLIEKRAAYREEHDYDDSGMPEVLKKNPYDEQMEDYRETEYYVATVPLLDEVPE